MSNVISYIFEVKDKMTAQLQSIQKSMESMTRGIQKQSLPLKQFFKDIPTWAGLYLEEAQNKMRKFQNHMQNFSQKMFALRNQALFVSLPTALFGKQAFMDAANYEQTLVQLQTAFGDFAGNIENTAKQLSKSTALNRQEVLGLAVALKQSAGLQNEQVMPFLESAAKVIYGVGSGGNFMSIMEQIKQGLGKDKLETVDIKVIESWGTPIKRMLAESLGIDIPQLMDKISEKGGGITKEMLVKTIMSQAEKYSQSLEKYAAGALGAADLLGEAAFDFRLAMGDLMIKSGMSEILRDITGWVEKLTEKVSKLSPSQKKFVFYLGLTAVALPPILMGLGLIASSISAIVGGLALLLTPWVAIGVAVGVILAIIYKFRKEMLGVIEGVGLILYKFTGLKLLVEKILIPVWNFLKAIGDIVVNVGIFIAKALYLDAIFKGIWTGMKAGLGWLVDKIAQFASYLQKIGSSPIVEAFLGEKGNVGNVGSGGLNLERAKELGYAEQIAKINTQQSMSAKVDLNQTLTIANAPKGTSMQSNTKSNASKYVQMGINSTMAYI